MESEFWAMATFDRRFFLKFALAIVAGKFSLFGQNGAKTHGMSHLNYSGANLEGWEVVLGDGIWAPAGELPVSLSDIATAHDISQSELRANIQQRRIMAHNITLNRVWSSNGNDVFDYVHECGYKFRMPYVPSQINLDLNAQTLEGGIFLWDGINTRLAYGMGFQWILNPWGVTGSQFGDIRAWTDTNDGQWVNVGHINPDTEWHEVNMTLNFREKTTSLMIDGQPYTSYFAGTTKFDNWARANAALFQAEIISIWPGDSDIHSLHKAQFSNWFWNWQSYNHNLFLPLIIN